MERHLKDFSRKIIFENNAFVQSVVGSNNTHLQTIEQTFSVYIGLRGNELFLSGEKKSVDMALAVLNAAYDFVAKGHVIKEADMQWLLHSHHQSLQDRVFTVGTKTIYARSPRQTDLMQSLKEHNLVFALGSAGTGKTYLAVAYGVKCLLEGVVKKLILVRPAVEAGENLGFLPGDMRDKVDPYMLPLYDALHDLLDRAKVQKLMDSGKIQVLPLAFMRGRTLSQSFVVLDEAQNATVGQMKMFLTRLGEGSYMAVTGDPFQVDLLKAKNSGLQDALQRLSNVQGVGHVVFKRSDVVRHGLVERILEAYEKKN